MVYGLSVLAGAWGFLAVFFAAVALRQTEVQLAGASAGTDPLPAGQSGPPAPVTTVAVATVPTVSARSLVFKEHLERLSEMILILLIGGTLFIDSWSWRAVGLALFLFLVARPVSTLAAMLGSQTSWPMRGMVGWFGVRGIGSLYYLMYAIQHGLPEPLAVELIQLCLLYTSPSPRD